MRTATHYPKQDPLSCIFRSVSVGCFAHPANGTFLIALQVHGFTFPRVIMPGTAGVPLGAFPEGPAVEGAGSAQNEAEGGLS